PPPPPPPPQFIFHNVILLLIIIYSLNYTKFIYILQFFFKINVITIFVRTINNIVGVETPPLRLLCSCQLSYDMARTFNSSQLRGRLPAAISCPSLQGLLIASSLRENH
ncbi:MAG: hypothetical protein LUG16_03850, partial [Candidatus Gastranaerophilales bacterium]|nr:hypothetical protein [Candidatus Gastranaerophilales bacterium]